MQRFANKFTVSAKKGCVCQCQFFGIQVMENTALRVAFGDNDNI